MTTITVWADIRCPWCWMGHRRLGAALERLGREVTVVRRSFLLEPAGPDAPDRTVRGAALNSWGMSEAEWDAVRNRVAKGGREDGLEIEMDGVRSIGPPVARHHPQRSPTAQLSPYPAHRLIKLAVTHGTDPERAWDRLFSAHLEQREDLEDPGTLRRIGTELGLDGGAVDALLDSGGFAAEVEADHRAAVEQGVSSIPAFVREGRALGGARSTDELVAFLNGAEAVR
ncbi:DsbA family oxidoreductase [Nocardiopsis ganjiahuensis]|uniref:DsbA family oxidoreductase n=1 Tax=Nocardiopsis ganjiahuensis TaxID=239984 RepID=UPI000477EC79|nr:DsbA family protein [Nocardiopsis ganjiahuensis]